MADPSNKKIMDLLVNPDPTNSWTYVVESGTNYRVQLGVASGVAVLNGAGALPAIQGGTGLVSYTAGNYINALNSTTLQQRTPAQVLADIGGSVDADVVHLSGTETITGSKTFSAPLLVQTASDTGFAVDKTGAATNSGMRFTTTSGSVYVGQGAANTFAVGAAATLAAGNWFNVGSTLATFSVNVSAGNNRVTAQQHAGPTTSVELGPTSSGTIFLSPNGVGSGTSQVSISTSGVSIPTNLTVGAPAALSGATFGSQVGASNTDLSKHLALYSSTFGFNITSGRMGVVFNGVDAGGWTAGGFNVNGAIAATGTITANSDITLKTDVETVDNALDIVDQWRGVRYTDKRTGERCIGVIAQEHEIPTPELVRSDEKGIKSVAYGNSIGVLIEAVKALRLEVAELKAQNQALKGI